MASVLLASQMGIRVAREMPAGVDSISHAWLLRGGYLFQHAAGIFYFSPLMYRVEQKVSALIAEEITKRGGSQVRLPILQNAELWKQSGRWDVYRHEKLMFQLTDRKEREFGLSPTAEEAVCDMAKKMIMSSAQLPLVLFQQNTKFRDELRPRSGLLRTREFIMMDAYSFDIDEVGLDVSYQKMRQAYQAIFERLGLNYITVQADSGAIGGASSEEFMSISEAGEDTLLFNDSYAANLEKAASLPAEPLRVPESEKLIVTANNRTLEEVSAEYGFSPSSTMKTALYYIHHTNTKERVAVLMRADGDVNLVKLANVFGGLEAVQIDEAEINSFSAVKPGFVGPFGALADLKLVADKSLEGLTSLLTGAGEPDKFALYVKPGRDFPLPQYVDIREAKAGELGPDGSPLKQCRGVEIGHIFKLGDKYSKALNAGVNDSKQTFRPFQMGCYGIGTTRVIAALADQNSNPQTGLVWPLLVAPFHVHLVSLKAALQPEALKLAASLAEKGIEVLVDDRKGSAGELLKDSDILGLPLRIVIGRDFTEGKVEFLNRLNDERMLIEVGALLEKVSTIVSLEIER